jgi:hypothetical protein
MNLDMHSPRTSFIVIERLEFLKGLPINDVTKSYISTLGPSSVEIITHNNHEKINQLDDYGDNHRVRVVLDKSDNISKILQDKNVKIFGDIHNAWDLDQKLIKLKETL